MSKQKFKARDRVMCTGNGALGVVMCCDIDEE